MILHHFHPARPHRHILLAIPALSLAVVDREANVVMLADRPGFTLPEPPSIGDMRLDYRQQLRRSAPRRWVPDAGLDLPEWIYLCTPDARHHFILHTTPPVFLCPFKPVGERYEILNPVADDGTLRDAELHDWLEIACRAAERAIAELAQSLGVTG